MATRQLKRENNALRKQIEEVMEDLSTLREGIKMADDELRRPRRSSEEIIQVDPKDLQFYSDSYDELRKLYKDASHKLKMIEKKLLTIESRVNELAVVIGDSEASSYQYNLRARFFIHNSGIGTLGAE